MKAGSGAGKCECAAHCYDQTTMAVDAGQAEQRLDEDGDTISIKVTAPAEPPIVESTQLDGQPPTSPSLSQQPPSSTSSSLAPSSSVLAQERTPPPSPLRPSDSTAQVRRRSVTDPRSNRLSGFFSNLMHRRDNALPGTPTSRNAVREEPPSAQQSRSASPTPPPRPTTPPPTLPPPTLLELGLSLSAITTDLSPSHFNTPPSSGAFLPPHYLLLCHSQGLDVLPLVSPPVSQPYALVRRVPFKSVAVMEQRGVLVAIAGRRDGVRVYSLDDIKKIIEWRLEFEIRREREKNRREDAKKATASLDGNPFTAQILEKMPKSKLSSPPSPTTPTSDMSKSRIIKRASSASGSLTPRSPVRKIRPTSQSVSSPPLPQIPSEQPPPYSSPPRPSPQASLSVRPTRARAGSVTEVLAGPSAVLSRSDQGLSDSVHEDAKHDDWVEGRVSDEEAIDIVAAGQSGSEALDERTSAQASSPTITPSPMPIAAANSTARDRSHSVRRNRPPDLDLSGIREIEAEAEAEAEGGENPPQPVPSPAPTLLTLREALSQSPITNRLSDIPGSGRSAAASPMSNDEDEDADQSDGTGERVTLAQALFESRIPGLPPAGTRRPQQPIFITSSHPVASVEDEIPASPRSSDIHSTDVPTITSRTGTTASEPSPDSRRRRRRWSVNPFANHVPALRTDDAPPLPSQTPRAVSTSAATSTANSSMTDMSRLPVSRTQSNHSRASASSTHTARPSTAPGRSAQSQASDAPPVPSLSSSLSTTSHVHSHSRLLSRLTNALTPRRSEDGAQPVSMRTHMDAEHLRSGALSTTTSTPPKLEYVKLPGTKGALMIKSVETAKKSFLAILCGDNGEKVELFAGTYRTALALSRTFILPDSPRLLELQLQGDDLVEVFLVFSQNVFGLEPATVRVREVRIGRAERRAARRRARELRSTENGNTGNEGEGGEDTNTNVNMSIGISTTSVTASADTLVPGHVHPADDAVPSTPNPIACASTLVAAVEDSAATATDSTPNGSSRNVPQSEELIALATAQAGPYTTFQQLSFSPNFPLATIADEYIIPPTYKSFLDYRTEHEPEVNGTPGSDIDLAQVQFNPPGLPVPEHTPPSKWFYRDPKGVIHGPWKASLMQSWYKDGLLPPTLPVRKEEETEYILLQDLRLQSVDPTHPFRAPPPPAPAVVPLTPLQEPSKPLLPPISLLSQPRHFGPPALFFSSRGGHSTTIVDARGRSVLKGRFMWSTDPVEDSKNSSSNPSGKLGDIKRLEAFDVNDRSVLVAMRQGGVEAMDIGDALLRPADSSRTALPHFAPTPSNINRRTPFVWRIGTPVASSSNAGGFVSALAVKSKGHGLHKKLATAAAATKSPGRSEFGPGETDFDRDEVVFLGRKDDEIYLCERISGSFRLLKLSPAVSTIKTTTM